MQVENVNLLALEHEFLPGDIENMDFISKLPKSEVKAGIEKYTLVRSADESEVEQDSRVKLMRHHYTRDGGFIKVNNPNFQSGMKLKLGGFANEELVACVKTMKPGEISYFFVQRDVIDKDEVIENPEFLTDAEKKRIVGNKLIDGYHRLEAVEEEKVKKNIAGVSESVESRLEHIASQKEAGNKLYKDYQYLKACKEYIKGYNLSSQFPKKKAEEENKKELLVTLANLRIDIINNCLKAAFKAKSVAACESLFDKDVVQEMRDSFKYVNSLAIIWTDTTQQTSVAMDVSSLIEYLDRFVREAQATEEEMQIIKDHLKTLNKYENSVNILSNLKSYTERAEEFEREEKIAEKIRKMQELARVEDKIQVTQE